MKRQPWHGILMSLCSCWLTLAASGDDFNFMRVALPSAFAGTPAGTIPLDDENTDFTWPSSFESRGQKDVQQSDSVTWIAWNLNASYAAQRTLPTRFSIASAQDDRPPHGDLRVPLRC
jgi:hypothetical protein